MFINGTVPFIVMLSDIREGIVGALCAASGLEAGVIEGALVRTQKLEHGDLAFPCFALAKTMQASPPECAIKLKAKVKLPAFVTKVENVGPYLNFFLDRPAVTKQVVGEILKLGTSVGRAKRDQAVIIEYSSPNIAKPFHVGHLRNTLIGLSIDRLYRHLGYKVTTINHIGDWGTQFGFVWAGCKLWGKPAQPTVEDFVELYRRASQLRKAQEENRVSEADRHHPAVNEMARDYFKRLEAGEREAREFWKWCVEISLNYFKKMYSQLGVHFDHYTGESFYEDKLEAVEKDLRASKILEESRGALGVELGKPLGFVRVFAEDGRSLYITRDIAAADYRYKTFKPSKILHIVGSAQSLHFKQLLAILKRMNHPAGDIITHVSYGMVPGISTRSGSADDKISLQALLEEATERALHAYHHEVSKRPEGIDETTVAEKVGLGAVFFEFLSRSNVKDFNFKWEHALSFQGDTGPYLQYALARLKSIEAKAAEEGIKVTDNFDAALLEGDESYQIVSLLGQFTETLNKAETSYEPHYITLYLLELAKTFSAEYRNLRVVGEKPELAKARLALFTAVKNVLETGLTLIGVPLIDRM